LPRAVRPGRDARRVILQAPRQALCPEIKGQMHQPAVTVGGDDAKPLFHPLPPSLDGGHSLPPVVITLARARAGVKTIRTNPLIVLDSAPEMQRIAAKSDTPTQNSLRTGNFFNLAGNRPAAPKQSFGCIPGCFGYREFSLFGARRGDTPECVFLICSGQDLAAKIYASTR